LLATLPTPNYEDCLTPRLYRLSQFAIVGLTLCLSACDGGEKKQLESKLQSAQLELEQVRTHTADRDQLYSEVVDAARFVSDIQLELSKVRSKSRPKNQNPSDLEHPNRSRAELLGDVKEVLSHLDSVEQRLTRFEGKARTTDSIRVQLVSLQKTIVSLRAAALDQQTQIENLSRELATVRVQRDSLADKVVGMQDVENTVFVIAKPLAELVKLGAVVEEVAGVQTGLEICFPPIRRLGTEVCLRFAELPAEQPAPEPLRPIDVPGQELDVNDLASHLASFRRRPERSGALPHARGSRRAN